MKIRLLPVLFALTLTPLGLAENVVLEGTGTVMVAQLLTGPFAGAQIGDTITVSLELRTPGSVHSGGSGSFATFEIDTPTFVLDIGGATAGVADGNYGYLENDGSFGDVLGVSLVTLDSDSMYFTLAVGDSSATLFDSVDPFEQLGTYPASTFDNVTFEVLDGSGGLLATLSSLTLRMESEGVPYCAGNGSAGTCPCGNSAGAGEGCANSSGVGASLRAFGSLGVSADDLGFAATGLLPGQPALLFVGNNALNGAMGTPFGDGLRCVGGAVRRLGLRIPDATGAALWEGGLASVGLWSVGDVRRFQVWYGDPSGGPCASQVNLSNAIEIAFVP